MNKEGLLKTIEILTDKLEKCKVALESIEINHNITDCCQSCGRKCEVCEQNREIAREALKEITQALDKKD